MFAFMSFWNNVIHYTTSRWTFARFSAPELYLFNEMLILRKSTPSSNLQLCKIQTFERSAPASCELLHVSNTSRNTKTFAVRLSETLYVYSEKRRLHERKISNLVREFWTFDKLIHRTNFHAFWYHRSTENVRTISTSKTSNLYSEKRQFHGKKISNLVRELPTFDKLILPRNFRHISMPQKHVNIVCV